MINLLEQAKKKVSKAMKNLDQLSKDAQYSTFEEQLRIAMIRNDLAVAQTKLDALILFHSKKNIDPNKVVEEYFKKKSQSCNCGTKTIEGELLQPMFNDQLN